MATVSIKEFQDAISSLYVTQHFKKKKDDPLNCILVSFEENRVVFLAADLDTCVRIKIKSWDVGDDKCYCYYPVLIPYQSLLATKDPISGRFLRIVCEGLNLKLESCGTSEIVEGRTNDLPRIDDFDGRIPKGEVTINRSEFTECVKVCEKYTYVGKHLSQPLLTGIHIVVTEDVAMAEATDGQFMMRATFPVKSQNSFNFTIPPALVSTLLRQKWEKVTISLYHDRIIAITETGQIEIQGMTMQGLYPSRVIDMTIGKTVISTIMSSRVVPQDLLQFLDQNKKSQQVTLVCAGQNFQVHGLDSKKEEQICFKRNSDGDQIAWASVSRKKLALIFAGIPVAVKEAIFHLSTNPTDKLPVVIAYSNQNFSFTTAIGQFPCSEESITRKREKELVETYSGKSLLPEAIEVKSADDSLDEADTFDVTEDLFPEGFFNK